MNPEAECPGKFAGTGPMPLSKAWRILPTYQQKEVLGSGQVSFTDYGSDSGDGLALELGRAQGRELGSGRPSRTGLGPITISVPLFTSWALTGLPVARKWKRGLG